MKKVFFFMLFSVAVFGQYKYTQTVTIASGDTLSSLLVLDYNTIAGISFPSAMTGTSLKVYTSNGLRIADVANLEAQMFNLK